MNGAGDLTRRVLAIAACLAGALASVPAFANGRYPASQQLVVDPGHPARLWVRATYGVLTSADAGKTWDYICESAVGWNPTEDPMLAVTSNGSVFAATVEGLLVTRDFGCNFEPDPEVGKRITLDVAVEGDHDHVLALTTERRSNGNYDLRIHRSDANSRNFAEVGDPIARDIVGTTLDPAPSDSQRIYVTGAVNPFSAAAVEAGVVSVDAAVSAADAPAVLLRTRDGGKTWERRPIPGATASSPAFIAAVHPTNPDVLYLRVQGPPRAFDPVESWLLYSEDAGDHFKELFHGKADMLGFALSPDGNRVTIGLGDSHDPSRPVDANTLGIYSATAPDFQFSRSLTGEVSCLTPSDAGLYVCGSHDSEGWEIGLSSNGGVSAVPLFDFKKARGPLVCAPSSTTAQACENDWPSVCGQVGLSCSITPPAVDAGFPPPVVTTPKTSSGGCSCAFAGTTPRRPALFLALSLLALVALRRSTRRRYS